MKIPSQTSIRNRIETWNLNVDKSTFSPGPGPVRLTLKVERSGDEEKVTADGVSASGQPTHSEYRAKYDGREHPITGSPTAETVSMSRIDALTTERVDKREGKVVEVRTRKLSPDGKTLTVTFTGSYAHNRPVRNEMVFERR
jgi:hypothetical protein